MKVLLDECIPRNVKNNLLGHDCYTVQEIGCAGTKNGAFAFSRGIQRIRCFLDDRQGLEYEQNLTGRNIAVLLTRPNHPGLPISTHQLFGAHVGHETRSANPD